MTKTHLHGAMALVFLFGPISVANADSYDGPFCFENPKDTTAQERQSYGGTIAIRGTCKQIEFQRIVSLDESMRGYHFAILDTSECYGESYDYCLRKSEKTATTSRAVSYVYAPLFVTKTMPRHYPDGRFIDVGYIASDDPFNSLDADEAINKSAALFTDVYGKPTFYPYSYYYKGNGGTYVPVTSPATKIIEYWHVTKKPNGFMLIKDKVETILDDGTVKVESNESQAATTSAMVADDGLTPWGRLVRFFKNVFSW